MIQSIGASFSVSPLNLTGGKLYFLEVVSIQKEDGGYFGVGVTIPSGVVVRPITKHHLAMYILGNGNHIYKRKYGLCIDRSLE